MCILQKQLCVCVGLGMSVISGTSPIQELLAETREGELERERQLLLLIFVGHEMMDVLRAERESEEASRTIKLESEEFVRSKTIRVGKEAFFHRQKNFLLNYSNFMANKCLEKLNGCFISILMWIGFLFFRFLVLNFRQLYSQSLIVSFPLFCLELF